MWAWNGWMFRSMSTAPVRPSVRPSVPSFQIEWRDDILENGTTNSASFEFDHRARSIVNPSMSYLAPRPLKRMPKWIARARSVRLVAQCPLFSEGEVLLQYSIEIVTYVHLIL